MESVVIARSSDRWLDRLLSSVAEACGMPALVVNSLADAELAVSARSPDLVVFDPAVAGTDYPFVARGTTRSMAFRCVGWLGSRSSPVVAALFAVGADEVLDASMGEEELAARLRRCLQAVVGVQQQPVQVGELTVDARSRVADWAGVALPLTSREIEVLQVLASAHGRPVRREVLYRLVWRWSMPRGDRTVDVNVKRLRDKLRKAETRVEIHTHHGVGYRLQLHAEDAAVTGL